jgi:hypothetical protein
MTTKPKTLKAPADWRRFVDPATLPDLHQVIIRGKCLEPVFKDGAKLLGSVPEEKRTLQPGRMMLRLRYLTLKLRALCWVLRRLRAGRLS